MTQRMGNYGRDIPSETQFLLVESEDSRAMVSAIEKEEEKKMLYTVFLPLLEGSFRASLRGNAEDHLQLCLESG
jgi:raffinose synthase